MSVPALLAGSLMLAGAALPSLANAADAAVADAGEGYDEEDAEVDELIVTVSRQQPGAVIGDIPPELQLTPRDIRAYGVSSVAELMDALSPQTASGRGRDGGRPIVLVNGQRISSFAEVRDLPPEAILRVDILPEEVALKYGYRADQRVTNLVLRPRFRAITTEAGVRTPTQGQGESFDAKASQIRIQRQNRFLLDGKVTLGTSVLESDRNLAAPRPDAAFRTLVPESQSLSLNGVWSRPLGAGVSGTVNGSVEATKGDSKLGLADSSILDPGAIFALPAPRALLRESDSIAGHAGVSLNGSLSGWRWSFTGNADRSTAKTTTDRVVLGAPFTDRSRSTSTTGDAELVVNGTVARLPAGPVSTTFKAGAAASNVDSRSLRAGLERFADLSRQTGSLQASIDLPIASRSAGVLDAIGDLSANLNFAVDELSDFGTLTTLGYGLNWSPIKPVRFIASFTAEDGAPSVQQLGAPEIVTPGVRVFDFSRGETVEISRIEGGTRGLQADNRQVLKLGMTLKPFETTDVTFTANYVRSRTRDLIASFPSATPEVEAVFPDRFVRDATGRLLQIDARPVNFDRRDTEELRWGFTFRKPLGPVRPAGGQGRRAGPTPAATPGQVPTGEGGRPAGEGRRDRPAPDAAAVAGAAPNPIPGGGRGAGRGGFGGGGRGFGGGGAGGGNLQIGLFHTLRLRDEILLRPGTPVLDLLNGGVIGNGGGQSRHQLDLQTNLSKNGYGLSLNTRWQSATKVESGTRDLSFSDLTTVNLRLFADLGQQDFVRRHPWLRRTRISLSVDNLFDARQDVRDASGATPISYQPDYLDPLGRTVRLSVRKVF